MPITNKFENYLSEHDHEDWNYSKMAKTYNEVMKSFFLVNFYKTITIYRILLKNVIALKVRGIDVLIDTVKVFVPNRNLKVLDIGAGTGLCGERLKQLKFSRVDGLELNKEMIDIAQENKTYDNYLNEGLFPGQVTSISESIYLFIMAFILILTIIQNFQKKMNMTLLFQLVRWMRITTLNLNVLKNLPEFLKQMATR